MRSRGKEKQERGRSAGCGVWKSGGRFGLGCRGRRRVIGGEALVEQGRDEGDGGDGDEGSDAIELVEFGEVVEEELEEGDSEEGDGGDAGGAGFFPDAGGEKEEGEKRPADGVGEIAGEVAGEVERERGAGRAEEVGDLDVEEEEAEDDAEGVEQRGRGEAENAIARRREEAGAEEEADDRETVGVEIPVEDRDVSARVIREDGAVEREAEEDDDEQDDAGGAEAGMRNAVKQPQEGGALERPGDGEPLTFELDGENEGQKEECDAAEPGELVEAGGRRRMGLVADGCDQAGERGECEGERDGAHEGVGPGLVDEIVDEREVHEAGEGRDGPRAGAIGEGSAEGKRKRGEERVEAGIPRKSDRGVFGDEETGVPGKFERAETGERAGGEPVDDEQAGKREGEHAEQERDAEERTGIGKRQPERHEHQQDKRQEGGESGDLSGGSAEDAVAAR
jgi:hypothetical protein